MKEATKTYALMAAGMFVVAAIVTPVLVFSMSDFEIAAAMPDGCPETAYVQVGTQTLALPRREIKGFGAIPCSTSPESPHRMDRVDIKNLPVSVPVPGKEDQFWDVDYKLRITPYDPAVLRPARVLNDAGPDVQKMKRAFAKAGYKFPNLEFSFGMGLLAQSGEPLLVSGCKNLVEVMRCSFDFVWQKKVVVEVTGSPFAPRYIWARDERQNQDVPVFEPYNPSAGKPDPVAELELEIAAVRLDMAQGNAEPEELQALEYELAELKYSQYEERATMTIPDINVANMYGLEYVQDAAFVPMKVIYMAAHDFMEDAAK